MAFDWIGTNQVPERAKEQEVKWPHGVQGVITWTRPTLERFESAYLGAISVNADRFMFRDCEFLVTYARHLIEYLDEVLE